MDIFLLSFSPFGARVCGRSFQVGLLRDSVCATQQRDGSHLLNRTDTKNLVANGES